jgi:hypothetical protein
MSADKKEQRQPVGDRAAPKESARKEVLDQGLETGRDKAPGTGAGRAAGAGGAKSASKSREDRLAEALRANLRRRKSAAKARDSD